MKVFKDFLNTEEIQKPPTVVIFPPKDKRGDFIIDIKYADFAGSLDIPRGYPDAECYIVPPYKPLLYIATRTMHSPPIEIFVLRGK